jgi:hypothetical protein
MSSDSPKLYLARHGDTAWTDSHKHTGRTDLQLNEQGGQHVRQLGGGPWRRTPVATRTGSVGDRTSPSASGQVRFVLGWNIETQVIFEYILMTHRRALHHFQCCTFGLSVSSPEVRSKLTPACRPSRTHSLRC